jgi:hypothetical protein
MPCSSGDRRALSAPPAVQRPARPETRQRRRQHPSRSAAASPRPGSTGSPRRRGQSRPGRGARAGDLDGDRQDRASTPGRCGGCSLRTRSCRRRVAAPRNGYRLAPRRRGRLHAPLAGKRRASPSRASSSSSATVMARRSGPMCAGLSGLSMILSQRLRSGCLRMPAGAAEARYPTRPSQCRCFTRRGHCGGRHAKESPLLSTISAPAPTGCRWPTVRRIARGGNL